MARKTILSDEGILSAIDKLGEQLEQNIIDTVSKKVTSGTEKGIKEANKKLKATKAKLEEATVVLEKVAVEVDDDALRKQAESVINKSVKNKPIKVKSKVEVEPEIDVSKYTLLRNAEKKIKKSSNELEKQVRNAYLGMADGKPKSSEKFVGHYTTLKESGVDYSNTLLKEIPDLDESFESLINHEERLKRIHEETTLKIKSELDLINQVRNAKIEAAKVDLVTPDKNGILSGNQSGVLLGTEDVKLAIEGQEKLQGELKETEVQARVTADAIREAYERRESTYDSWDKESINRSLQENVGNSGGTRKVLSDLKNAHEAYDLSIDKQWNWETQYQWAVKFIAFYEEYASRADGTAQSLAKHTELYNQLKPLAEGYRADLQAVLDYKPQSNQTEVLLPKDTTAPVEESIKLQDNLGREIDENNAKLLKGTQLIDEQNKGILTLYHNSNSVFDKFDSSKSGENQGMALGAGNYLSTMQNGEYNNLEYGKFQTQWYAFVKNAFDMQKNTISQQEADTIAQKYFGSITEGFGKYLSQNLSSKSGSGAVNLLKDAADKAQVSLGEIFNTIGYDAIKDAYQINVFNEDNIVRASNAILDISQQPFENAKELSHQLYVAEKSAEDTKKHLESLESINISGLSKDEAKKKIEGLDNTISLNDLMGVGWISGKKDKEELAAMAVAYQQMYGESLKLESITQEIVDAHIQTGTSIEAEIERTKSQLVLEEEKVALFRQQANEQLEITRQLTDAYLNGNQTPLLSDNKSGEEAKETAQEIEQADEQIENADEEVVKAEEKVAQTTIESRDKASNAAKKHAKETKQASEEVLAALRKLEEEQKVLYDEESFKNRDVVSQSGLKEVHKELGEDGELHDVGNFSFLEKLQDGQLQRVLVTYEEETEEWYEKVLGVSTAFEQVGKEIISLDDKIKQYEMNMDKQKAAHPTYNTSADERLIDLAKERQAVLLETLGFYHDEEEYAYKMNEFEEKRAINAERLKALTEQNSNLLQAKAEEKAIKAAEQHAEAIAKANRLLNNQEKTIEHIERTYNKAVNPDLEKSVTNQNDLTELAAKKKEIQDLIAKLKNAPRDASNEQDYLDLEKMIAAYKDLADYKKKANNPTKAELGGQSLQTAIAEQIAKYTDLINKAKAFGDATSANVALLEKQLKTLKQVDADGKYTSTSFDYYSARDLYKIEKSDISVIESGIKSTEKATKQNNVAANAYKNLVSEAKEYYDLRSREMNNELVDPKDINRLNDLKDKFQRAAEGAGEFARAIDRISGANLGSKESNDVYDLFRDKFSDDAKNSYLASLEKDIADYQKFYKNIDANKRNLQPVAQYKQNIDELETAIKSLNALRDQGVDLVDSDELKNVALLKARISELSEEVRRMKNNKFFQVGDFEEVYSKMADIEKTLEKNTRMSKEMRQAFKDLKTEYNLVIDTGKSEADVEALNVKLAKLNMELEASGKTGRSFFDLIGKKMRGMAAQFFAMYLSLQDLLQIARRGFEVIKEYDKALTDMNKVAEESLQTLKAFQQESFALADSIGTTASAIQNSTADWMKLGKSLEEAKELASTTAIYSNVGDLEISDATEHMVSTLQAFNIEASNSMEIVDKLNAVSNNYAISASGIGEALERSSAAFNAANTDLSSSISLITATMK